MISQDDLKTFINLKNGIKCFCEDFVKKTCNDKFISINDFDVVIGDVDKKLLVEFEYEYKEACGCCTSTYYESFPAEYMWSDDWEELEEQRKLIELKNRAEVKKIRDRKELLERIKAEKDHYEILKKKFNNK